MTGNVDRARPEPTLQHKRVILVIGNLKLGGAERQAFLLARELIRAHGARVEVWGFAGPGPSPHVWDEHWIPWEVVRSPWARGRARRIRRLVRFAWKLRRACPDVVLSFTIFPNVTCGLTWRWSGARSFLWGQCDALESLGGSPLERLAVRSTPWFISNSQHARDFMGATLRVPRERIQVIPNGVEMPSPQQGTRAWRSRLGVDEDCFTGCMLAHLHGRKDHAVLIRSWRIVADRLARRKVRAVLALAGGQAPESARLRALVTELGLEEHVCFLGFVNDVSGLLAAVDVGVFSSRSEGCPNGVLECMDAGLAVAGTDIPGIREALGPEGLPFLAPPGDEKRLAEAILDLAEDPALRARVGAANRERIRREFRLEELVGRYAAVIRKELSATARRDRPPGSSARSKHDRDSRAERGFQENLADWCAGGPSAHGWTRTGPRIRLRHKLRLGPERLASLSVEECLAMNSIEAERWHVSFLREYGDRGDAARDYENSAYYRDYLAPRYDPEAAHRRIQSFLALYESIRREGLRTPIIAADVAVLDLGFRYFRFDGCHRVAACKVLGIPRVSARIFETEVVTLGSRLRDWIPAVPRRVR